MLNNEHIDFVIKDLYHRGIVVDEIQEELVDHVCSLTERRMESGEKFMDAYAEVLKDFGHTGGLRQLQNQTLKNQTKNYMWKNYLTIATRNLKKQGVYSFINIAGLAIGVAACLIIVLFIIDELNYD